LQICLPGEFPFVRAVQTGELRDAADFPAEAIRADQLHERARRPELAMRWPKANGLTRWRHR
jgi:hypothetical protein